MLKNSPGGGYFPYFYKGGQLFGLHLGSFYADEEGAIARMRAEGEFLTAQNQGVIGIWIDLCQTRLSKRVLGEFIEFLARVRPCILKLALVGCSLFDRWKLQRLIRKDGRLAGLTLRFYSDPEEAKTWLVSEGDA
jgi:hypothetical protein